MTPNVLIEAECVIEQHYTHTLGHIHTHLMICKIVRPYITPNILAETGCVRPIPAVKVEPRGHIMNAQKMCHNVLVGKLTSLCSLGVTTVLHLPVGEGLLKST